MFKRSLSVGQDQDEDSVVSKQRRILILTFYFEPDLCAGSFRASALVNELQNVAPPELQIDVVTTLPNRYQTFTVDVAQDERRSNVSIHRIALPTHKSGMIDQSKAFLSFARGTVRHVEHQEYDIVYATSSRLMTAVLGAYVSWRKNARLYLDIRDIFVDTIKDVLSARISWLFKPLFSLVERYTMGRASRINLVSRGFEDYFRGRYPNKQLSFFTNGIDDEFLDAALEEKTPGEPKESINVVYAGNIGEGQGLHNILPALSQKMGARVKFTVIGDGGRKNALQEALKSAGATNVELLPPMSRDRLLAAYRNADVLFLHLNDYDAFKKVLPSKIFEYAAMGKPVWAGVSGYSAEFLASEVENVAVFKPCDANGASDAFSKLSFQTAPRDAFVEKYARASIMKAMAKDVLNTYAHAS